MILLRKHDILNSHLNAPEIHSLLRTIPETLDIEELITTAIELYSCYPPSVFLTKEHLSRMVLEMIQKEQIYEKRILQRKKSITITPSTPTDSYRFLILSISSLLIIGLIAWLWGKREAS
jgi:hypothetical protein